MAARAIARRAPDRSFGRAPRRVRRTNPRRRASSATGEVCQRSVRHRRTRRSHATGAAMAPLREPERVTAPDADDCV